MSGISINKLVYLLQLLCFPKLKKIYAFFLDCDIANGKVRVLWASVFGENRRLGISGTRIAHSIEELTLA